VITPNDEEMRALVDDDGLLREGAIASPPREEAYTVFGQRRDARFEMDAWERHAAQFFATRVGLTIAKRYDREGGAAPVVDVARIVIAPNDGPPGTRFCFARPREGADFDVAEAADIRAGSPGLGLLARRCEYVWLVVAEGESDRVALLGAAIIASVVLGPILSPDQRELFGVRTARAKLEKLEGGAYR
jgi:hypothetical protein